MMSGTPKQIRGVLARPCIVALVYAELGVTLIYILGDHGARDPGSSLSQRGQS